MANFKIGVMTDSFKIPFMEALDKAVEVGAQGVQVYAVNTEMDPKNLDDAKIEEIKKALRDKNLVISALCADYGGHGFAIKEDNVWKVEGSKRVAELAKKLDCTAITTHIGVIPEDKTSERYKNMQDACNEIGKYADTLGVRFAIETGPEPAARLKDFLDGLDTRGVGVNFDPANFHMVTNQDVVEGVHILKDYIVHTHAKDGIVYKYTDPQVIYDFFAEGGCEDIRMGDYFLEVPLGQGGVPWDAYLNALREVGYNGFLTIERECGADPYADIKLAADFLRTKI